MGCTCSLNDVTLPTAQAGADGANGSNGLFGGFSQKFIFETTLTSGPLTKKLRFNNATLASVTEVYVNDNNSDSVNVDAFLDALDNSGNGGKIKIFKEYDSTVFFMADVASSTDNGSDHTLAVTHVASNGTFANDDAVVLSFVPNGVIGTNGTNGTDGTPLLFADTNNDINTSKSLTAFTNKSYTLPANTLTADGDSIQGLAYFYSSVVANEKSAQATVELHIGGSKAHTELLVQNAGRQYSMIEYVFTRTSVIAGRLTLKFCKEYVAPQILTSTITGLDFTTTTVIQLYSTEVSSQNFHCNKKLITLLKQ